jgi:hypothetical protein
LPSWSVASPLARARQKADFSTPKMAGAGKIVEIMDESPMHDTTPTERHAKSQVVTAT